MSTRPGSLRRPAAVLGAQSTQAALALPAELPTDQAEVVALRVLALEAAEVARIVGKRPGAGRGASPPEAAPVGQTAEAGELMRAVTP